MKKPNKILLSLLIASTGIALTSSITSTVAWFVYATNATVAYTGTSAHCSKLLNISVDNGVTWGTDILSSQLPSSDPSDPTGVKFKPITTGAQLANAALPTQSYPTGNVDDENNPIMGTKTKFYASPDYRQGSYENWLIAEDNNYLQFTVLIKLIDVDENYGNVTATDDNQKYLSNDVYLTDLTIEDPTTTNDLSKAVRVHFASTYTDENNVVQHEYLLFSKRTSPTSTGITNVGGYLDLNDDGKLDTVGYEYQGNKLCLYGGSDGVEDSTITTDDSGNITSAVLSNPLVQKTYLHDDHNVVAKDNKGNITDGKSLGKTSGVAGQYLQVTVTIWLEGWSELAKGTDDNYHGTNTSVWDSTSYASKQFNIGMTFGVKLHADHDE